MKHQQKRRILQKLWGWICLSVNCMVATLFLAHTDKEFLVSGAALSISTICYGFVKTYRDKSKDDLSGVSVAIQYICIYIITLVIALKLSDYLSSFSPLIYLSVISLIELLVVLVLTNWCVIKRILRKS